MSRQHVAVKFNPDSERTYTYHNDGDHVAPGDRVLIETGRGTKTVTVHSVHLRSSADPPLEFETKGILGLAPPPEDSAS